MTYNTGYLIVVVCMMYIAGSCCYLDKKESTLENMARSAIWPVVLIKTCLVWLSHYTWVGLKYFYIIIISLLYFGWRMVYQLCSVLFMEDWKKK